MSLDVYTHVMPVAEVAEERFAPCWCDTGVTGCVTWSAEVRRQPAPAHE
jgi:hypothetical protein